MFWVVGVLALGDDDMVRARTARLGIASASAFADTRNAHRLVARDLGAATYAQSQSCLRDSVDGRLYTLAAAKARCVARHHRIWRDDRIAERRRRGIGYRRRGLRGDARGARYRYGGAPVRGAG